MAGRPYPQNAKRNAEIIRRRKAGEWPHEIAATMALERNIVIGVCWRAGLSHASNAIGPGTLRRPFTPRVTG